MANIFVDPDGSNTSPYDTIAKARTSLNAGFGVAGDGDTIIMTNRLDHVVSGNASLQSDVRTLMVQNEDGDSDFTKVGFTSWGATNVINLNNSTAATAGEAYMLTIKGITINPATVTGGSGGPIATPGTGADSRGLTLNLVGVKFDGIDSTGLSVNGGSVRISAAETSTSSEFVNVNMTGVVWEDCIGGDGSLDPNDNKTVGYFSNTNVVMIGCTQLNCGDVINDFAGHLLIQSVAADSAGVERTALVQNHFAENCIAGQALGGDGGAIYFYAQDDTRTLYTNKMTVTVEDSEFKLCGARKGGAFWVGLHADGVVRRCTFTENFCLDFGGGAIGKGANTDTLADIGLAIESSLFVRNEQRGAGSGQGGGAIRCDKSKWISATNCTFVDNTAEGDEDGQAIWVRDHSGTVSPTKSSLINCVFTGASTQVTTEADNGFTTIDHCAATAGLSDFQDTGATITNISTTTTSDYANFAGDDFSLSSGSSLIAAGNDSVLPLNDINNNPFVSVVDIGAYRSTRSPTLTTPYSIDIAPGDSAGSATDGAVSDVVAGKMKLFLGSTVDLTKRQSIVGNLTKLFNYMMTNAARGSVTSGDIVVFGDFVSLSQADITLTNVTSGIGANDAAIVVSSSFGSAINQTIEYREAFRKLTAQFLSRSTGN